MVYFTKWPEVYTIPNQEALTVADALVNNFFCCFGVLMELHSKEGQNFDSRLMQEVLEQLRVSKIRTIPYTHSQMEWWNATCRRSRST
jgi:hypothetical protein